MYRWLKTILHKRYRRKENCLYLVGDGDELGMVEALERRFGIAIGDDPQIAKASDVGLLFDIVVAHSKSSSPNGDQDRLWTEMCRFLAEYTGYQQQINRQTTFFYYR